MPLTCVQPHMMDYQNIFEAIRADERYQNNLNWGEPRRGHPEATVRAHVAELEINLKALQPRLSETDYWKLKVLIHVHDTFKADSKHGVPITHPQSHASLARAFLAEFCDDADLLAMVQYHDEPFALYQQIRSKGTFKQERFKALLHAVKDWNLFLAFLLIDGCTEGKVREPLLWFFTEVAGEVESSFTAADIL